MTKLIIYDCEIIRCIPPSFDDPDPDLEYCGGWGDHENMGISVISTYSENLLGEGARGVNTFVNYGSEIPLDPMLRDSIQEFFDLADVVIGFNSVSFDDRLMAANGINVLTTYDLLREVRIASGQPGDYVKGQTRAGYSLGAIAEANGLGGKSGSGELAPVLWQRGDVEAVVKYCEHDIELTRQIWERRYDLIDPTNGVVLRLA